jgi:hypothetical protein
MQVRGLIARTAVRLSDRLLALRWRDRTPVCGIRRECPSEIGIVNRSRAVTI